MLQDHITSQQDLCSPGARTLESWGMHFNAKKCYISLLTVRNKSDHIATTVLGATGLQWERVTVLCVWTTCMNFLKTLAVLYPICT